MIYLVILLILLIFSLKYDELSSGNNETKNTFVFLAIIFIVFVSISFEIGDDTLVYINEYASTPKLNEFTFSRESEFSKYQNGWNLLMSVCRTISPNFVFLQFVHAIIVNVIIFYLINKYSKNRFYTILCFFLINFLDFNFEIYRESIAVCIALLAWDAINVDEVKIKNVCISLLCFFIAYEFHLSALVAPLLLLGKLKRSKFGLIAVVSFSLLIPLSINVLDYDFFLNLLLSENANAFFNDYYQIEQSDSNIFGWIILFVKYISVPIVFLILEKDDKSGIVYLIFIYAVFRMMAHTSTAFLRFSNYFAFFYWLAVTDIVCILYRRFQNKILVMVMVTLLIMYIFDMRLLAIDTLNSAPLYERYFPYETILNSSNSYL